MNELIPFDNLFKNFNNIWKEFDKVIEKSFRNFPSIFDKKSDITSDDKNVYVEIDMPGFEKSDIKIEVKRGYLTICAEKEVTKKKGKSKRSANYAYYINTDVDITKANASYQEGILKVTLPKTGKDKESNIKIE